MSTFFSTQRFARRNTKQNIALENSLCSRLKVFTSNSKNITSNESIEPLTAPSLFAPRDLFCNHFCHAKIFWNKSCFSHFFCFWGFHPATPAIFSCFLVWPNLNTRIYRPRIRKTISVSASFGFLRKIEKKNPPHSWVEKIWEKIFAIDATAIKMGSIKLPQQQWWSRKQVKINYHQKLLHRGQWGM